MSGECDDCGEHTLDCKCKSEWIDVNVELPKSSGEYFVRRRWFGLKRFGSLELVESLLFLVLKKFRSL